MAANNSSTEVDFKNIGQSSIQESQPFKPKYPNRKQHKQFQLNFQTYMRQKTIPVSPRLIRHKIWSVLGDD
jgi:hypothetical protein